MFNLKRPCDNCPFRSDVKPFIYAARAREIVRSLEQNGMFHCHKTISHDEETSEYVASKDDQLCAGASIVMLKMERPNQMLRIGMRTGWDPQTMDMNAPVYKSFKHFIAAHVKSSAASRLPK